MHPVSNLSTPPNKHLVLQLPFVGRQSELQQLHDLWQHTSNSTSFRLVTVEGAKGVGKSRLLEELITSQQSDIASGINVHCTTGASENPLSLLADQLQNMGILAPDGDANEPVSTSLILSTIRQHSRRFQTLLIFDNLHEAHKEGIAQLTLFLESLANESLIVVLSFAPFPLSAMLVQRRTHSFHLSALTSREYHEIIRKICEPEPFNTASVAVVLHQTTAGNPYVLRSVLNLTISDGLFSYNAQHRLQSNIALTRLEAVLPGYTARLAEILLDVLDGKDRHLVEQVARLGNNIPEEIILELPETTKEQLENLVARRVLCKAQSGNDTMFGASSVITYSFTHQIVFHFLLKLPIATELNEYLLRIIASETPFFSPALICSLRKGVSKEMPSDRALILAVLHNLVQLPIRDLAKYTTTERRELLDLITRLSSVVADNSHYPILHTRHQLLRMFIHSMEDLESDRLMSPPGSMDEYEELLETTRNPETKEHAHLRITVLAWQGVVYKGKKEILIEAAREIVDLFQKFPALYSSDILMSSFQRLVVFASRSDYELNIELFTCYNQLVEHAPVDGDNTVRLHGTIGVAFLTQQLSPNKEQAWKILDDLYKQLDKILYEADFPDWILHRVFWLYHNGNLNEAYLTIRRNATRIQHLSFAYYQVTFRYWTIVLELSLGIPITKSREDFEQFMRQEHPGNRSLNFYHFYANFIALRGDWETASELYQEYIVQELSPEQLPVLKTYSISVVSVVALTVQPENKALNVLRDSHYFTRNIPEAAILPRLLAVAQKELKEDVIRKELISTLAQAIYRPSYPQQFMNYLSQRYCLLFLVQYCAERNLLKDGLTPYYTGIVQTVEALLDSLYERQLYALIDGILERFGHYLAPQQQQAWKNKLVALSTSITSSDGIRQRYIKLELWGNLTGTFISSGKAIQIQGQRNRTLLSLLCAYKAFQWKLEPDQFYMIASGSQGDAGYARRLTNTAISRLRARLGKEAIRTDGDIPIINTDIVQVDLLDIMNVMQRVAKDITGGKVLLAYLKLFDILKEITAAPLFGDLEEPLFEAARTDFECKLRDTVFATIKGLIANNMHPQGLQIVQSALTILAGDEELEQFRIALLRQVGASSHAEILKETSDRQPD